MIQQERPDDRVGVGVRVGVDYGSVRLGFAKSDPTGLLATPYEISPALSPDNLEETLNLVVGLAPVVVYVGEPVSLRGEATETTQDARAWASALSKLVGDVPVRMLDERLTSTLAESHMRARGQKPSRSKASVDSNAAAVLLQGALDFERRHQLWAGRPLEA